MGAKNHLYIPLCFSAWRLFYNYDWNYNYNYNPSPFLIYKTTTTKRPASLLKIHNTRLEKIRERKSSMKWRGKH